MAITRTLPLKDNPTEGYEEPFNRNVDALDTRGEFFQNDVSNDSTVVVQRDVSNNLTFLDGIGGPYTLAQLAASGTGVTYTEFLLDCEPIAETGANDSTYAATYSGNKITNEEWRRNDATLLKSIAYTYTGNKLTTEVRKVFAANGSTIVAQVTWTYVYTGNKLTSATMIRNT